MIDLDVANIDDLKSGPRNPGPMTAERAFTICELVAYRIRDASSREMERAAATLIANAIMEIERTWR